jgi:nicotinamidase-related amidase
MLPGDRMVLYATGRQAFAFTATITSPYWEDHTLVWDGRQKGEDYPFRVQLQPDVVLPEEAYVSALSVLPELDFPRKWPAQHWHLAFQGNVHPDRRGRLRADRSGDARRCRGARGRRAVGRGAREEAPMRHTIPWQDPTASPLALAELSIDPARTALLVVDMQQYSGLPARVSETNRRLCELFRAQDLPVVFLRVGSLLPDARDQHPKRRLSWLRAPGDAEPPRVPRGSAGFEVLVELAPRPTELVLDKNSTSAFVGAPLDLYLRNFGVENLVVTGTSTNHCVDNTARDAADRGFNVILVDDACADGSPTSHCTTMAAFGRHFGAVRRTDEVIALFSRLLDRAPAAV